MKTTRRITQAGFLALTLAAVFVLGSHAELWCPFGGVEAMYTYAREGNLLCSLGVSNFYAFGAVLLTVLLVRRAFCGYMCPLGAISEWLRAVAGRLGLPALRVPAKTDRALALAKYAVLAAILIATWRAGELVFRGYDPCYALLSRHGADITFWAYVVAGAIAAVSLVAAMPFCRWFCPLAAVLNPFSRLGLARIKRDSAACTGCGQCAASCPMAIPVDRLPQVTASRCLACMNCVDACRPKTRRALSWGPPHWLGHAWPQAMIIAVLVLCSAAAVAAVYLAPLPSFVKSRGTPPEQVATVELQVQELTCRGRANLLVGFLDRDDMYQIPGATPNASGYYKLEGLARSCHGGRPHQLRSGIRRRGGHQVGDYGAVLRHERESLVGVAVLDRGLQSAGVVEAAHLWGNFTAEWRPAAQWLPQATPLSVRPQCADRIDPRRPQRGVDSGHDAHGDRKGHRRRQQPQGERKNVQRGRDLLPPRVDRGRGPFSPCGRRCPKGG